MLARWASSKDTVHKETFFLISRFPLNSITIHLSNPLGIFTISIQVVTAAEIRRENNGEKTLFLAILGEKNTKLCLFLGQIDYFCVWYDVQKHPINN